MLRSWHQHVMETGLGSVQPNADIIESFIRFSVFGGFGVGCEFCFEMLLWPRTNCLHEYSQCEKLY